MRREKGGVIPAVVVVILAVLTAVGVKTFLSPCVHEDGTFGACHWAGQAVFGLAIVIAAQGVIAIAWKDAAVRTGLYLAMAFNAILGILTPGILISLCAMADMRCRMIMRPAMIVLFSLQLVCAAAGVLLSNRGRA